jgi:hypothetical protein
MRTIRLVVAAHREAETRRAFSAPAIVKAGQVPEQRSAGPEGGTHRQRVACAGHQSRAGRPSSLRPERRDNAMDTSNEGTTR